MTVDYDPEADAAYVRFSEAPVARTHEESDVCIVDLDASGKLVGVELLSVFGFAGASLSGLVSRGLLSSGSAGDVLRELRSEAVAA